MGFKNYVILGYKLERSLGSGRYCKAIEAISKKGSQHVVVKIYDTNDVKVFENEKRMLELLHSRRISQVPSIVEDKTEDSYLALVLTPVGIPLSDIPLISGSQFAILVDVLRQAHEALICHRDVKPGK